MSVSWVISRYSATDLNGQTVEFHVPDEQQGLHGVGVFEARALSGRRVMLKIRWHAAPDWGLKDGLVLRIPQQGAGKIEIHPKPSVARYRLFAV